MLFLSPLSFSESISLKQHSVSERSTRDFVLLPALPHRTPPSGCRAAHFKTPQLPCMAMAMSNGAHIGSYPAWVCTRTHLAWLQHCGFSAEQLPH